MRIYLLLLLALMPAIAYGQGVEASRIRKTTFSSLGTPSDSNVRYCTDCAATSPCTGSGTGATATRINSAWNCSTGGSAAAAGANGDIQVNSSGSFGGLTPGTGITTALAVNVGAAGSPVINGGALGTPSSGVGTNLTGTATGLTAGNVTTNANLTGDVTSAGNATAIASGVIVNADVNASAAISATKLVDGTVSDAELQFINTLSSNAQTQIDAKAPLASPTFTGTVTLPAVTLGGTIAGGGNQLNNIIIGTTTPLAGTFTTGVFGSTTSLLLGTAGSAVGNIGFRNATSGTATLAPPTGALGTYSITLPNAASVLPIYGTQITYAGPSAARTVTYPDANFTIARIDAANTFIGASSTTSWAETTPVITGGLTASGSGANTFAGSSGTFLTSTGAVTVGPGATGFSGITTFTPPVRSSGVASYFTLTPPADTGQTTATESIGVNFATATRTWVDGTVALQRERFFAGPTYNKTTTSATFTDVFNSYFTPPVAGSGVTFTRGHTLGIVDSTSAASAITGGLVVATTLGTAATSVGIGGGNVFAGGTMSVGANPATTGTLNLPNNTNVSFRNAANNADLVGLSINSSNTIIVGNNSTVLGLAGGLWSINNATGALTSIGAYPFTTSGAVTASGSLLNTGITADTAHTDTSVCQDTTTHQFYSGTGTLGVCLGTSSLRFKNHVKPLTGGLDEIMALRPISFLYNRGYGDNGARRQYGFAAEEVRKPLPELVGLDAKGRANSVDMLGMLPKAILAIQQLNTRLTALEKENSRLRAQLRHRRSR